METTRDFVKTTGTLVIDGVSYDVKQYNEDGRLWRRLVDRIVDEIECYVQNFSYISRTAILWVNARLGKAVIGNQPMDEAYQGLPVLFLVKRDYNGDIVPDREKVRDFAFGFFESFA